MMLPTLLLTALTGAAAVELATRHALYGAQHRRLPASGAPAAPAPVAQPGQANCTTRWMEQPIDHFSWAGTPTGALTYQQRYLTYADHWRNDSTGMIFFYVGNEGDVGLCACRRRACRPHAAPPSPLSLSPPPTSACRLRCAQTRTTLA